MKRSKKQIVRDSESRLKQMKRSLPPYTGYDEDPSQPDEDSSQSSTPSYTGMMMQQSLPRDTEDEQDDPYHGTPKTNKTILTGEDELDDFDGCNLLHLHISEMIKTRANHPYLHTQGMINPQYAQQYS